MNDLLWYGRLIAWTGIAVLIIEAVTGKSSGPLTLLAVLFLVGGFAAFLAALYLARDRGENDAIRQSAQDSPPFGA